MKSRAIAIIMILCLILPLTAHAADTDWRNILLIGVDDRDEGMTGLADALIIASINTRTGTVKLTSLMRDTLVDIPGRKDQAKLNAAHSYGGVNLLFKTIKANFGLDITEYAKIDVFNMQYAIERLGGIDIPVAKKEVEWINRGMAYLIGKEKELGRYDGKLNDDPLSAGAYGDSVHLTGRQAIAYARIRNIDSDFMRTNRQRVVLEAMLDKARKATNPITFASVALSLIGRVQTNLTVIDAITLGGTMLFKWSGRFEMQRLPADGEFEEDLKGYYILPDWAKTQARLKQFIYD